MPDSEEQTDRLKELAQLVAVHNGEIDRTITRLSLKELALMGSVADGIGILPTPSAAGLSVLTYLAHLPLTTTISFSGGIAVAIKFLHEARATLAVYLQSKAKQKVIIKVGIVSVEIQGSDDIDAALAAFYKLVKQQSLPAPSNNSFQKKDKKAARPVNLSDPAERG